MEHPLPGPKALPAQGIQQTAIPLPSLSPQHQLLTAGRGLSMPPQGHETSLRCCHAPQTPAPGLLPGKAASAGPWGSRLQSGAARTSLRDRPCAGCPNKGTVVPCEGPGTPHRWRSRAKRVLDADSAPGCQVPVQRPYAGPASEGPHSWAGSWVGVSAGGLDSAGGAGKGCPACSETGPVWMSGRGGESGWGDGDLGGRVCREWGGARIPWPAASESGWT